MSLLHCSTPPLLHFSYLGFFLESRRVVGFFVPFFVGFLVTFVGFFVGAGCLADFLSFSFSFFLSPAFAGTSLLAAALALASAFADLPFTASGCFTGSGSGGFGTAFFGKRSLQFGSISSINFLAFGPYGFLPTSIPN